jgi:hypothetical protein
VIRARHGSPLIVDDPDRDDTEISAVRVQRFAIRLEHDACGSARRFPPSREDQLAVAIASRLQNAGRELHLPLRMPVARHGTPTEAATVEQQLDAFEVRVTPHLDLLSGLPVPMRQEVQGGRVAPLPGYGTARRRRRAFRIM